MKMKHDNSMQQKDNIIFRESIVPLVFRIIGLELAITLIHLFSDSIILSLGGELHGTMYSLVMTVLPHVLNTVLIVWIMSLWATTSYVIKPGELIIRTGVLRIREGSFAITNFENVSITQSLIGRICNYGTLHVSSPLFKKDLLLTNLHEPSHYASLLQETQAALNSSTFLGITTK